MLTGPCVIVQTTEIAVSEKESSLGHQQSLRQTPVAGIFDQEEVDELPKVMFSFSPVQILHCR